VTDHRATAEKNLMAAERLPGYRAFFDGCTEPVNPGGTAGYGGAILRGAERVHEFSGMIPPSPTTSNNVAEYLAVIEIFDWFLARDRKVSAMIFGDSRLVICQLWGWPSGARKWKVHGVDDDNDKHKGFYADAAKAAREKLRLLPKLRGFWIPRDLNSIADELSKAELRRLGVEFRIQPEEAA
jgi:ribonuclease HI